LINDFLVAIGDLSSSKIDIYNQSKSIIHSISIADAFRFKLYSNSLLAKVSGGSTLGWQVWNRLNWTLIQSNTQTCNGVIYDCEYIDSNTLAVGGPCYGVDIYNIQTGMKIKNFTTSTNLVNSLKLITHNLLAAGGYGKIDIYNLSTWSVLKTLDNMDNAAINDIALISESWLASGSQAPNIKIWDFTLGTLIYTLIGHTGWVNSLTVISSTILASGAMDWNIILWDLKNGQSIYTLNDKVSGYIQYSLDFYNDDVLICGYTGWKINFWQISTGRLLSTFDASHGVLSLIALDKCKFKKN